MLSRATLPLLRPQSFQTASRPLLSRHQARGVKNYRDRLRFPGDFKIPSSSGGANSFSEPLRPVPRSPSEHIYADSWAHDPSTLRFSTHSSDASRPSQNSHTAQETVRRPAPSPRIPEPQAEISPDHDPDAQSQPPLPDLTQGIPSTIDAELSQASSRGHASRESLNITEEAADPQSPERADRGGDGLPRSSYVSSSDQRRNALTKYFYTVLGLGAVLTAVYMGRNWDAEEADLHKDVAQGYSPGLMYQRAMARWGTTVDYYTEPVTKKLLPDQGMDPNLPPYTLVIGLEDVLVRSEWSRDHGWRIAKRPGLDYFLKYLHSYYELVLFSKEPSFTVDQIHRKIDPYQLCYPLYREMTVYEDGGYVKDLAYLNRDLKKVVSLDADTHAVKKQPENAIVIPKWDGNPRDTTLIDLIPFLENLASLGYPDTREVLKSFDGKNIAVEFDKRQHVMRERWQAEQAQKKRNRGGGGFSLGSMFSSKPKMVDGIQSIHEAEAEGKMYSDIVRERGQQVYQRLHEHLEKEGPKMLAEREAIEKKMQEEAMANMKTGMFGFFAPSQKKEST